MGQQILHIKERVAPFLAVDTLPSHVLGLLHLAGLRSHWVVHTHVVGHLSALALPATVPIGVIATGNFFYRDLHFTFYPTPEKNMISRGEAGNKPFFCKMYTNAIFELVPSYIECNFSIKFHAHVSSSSQLPISSSVVPRSFWKLK